MPLFVLPPVTCGSSSCSSSLSAFGVFSPFILFWLKAAIPWQLTVLSTFSCVCLHIFLGKGSVHIIGPFFNWVVFLLSLRLLYIFWIQMLCQICDVQILSFSVWLVFLCSQCLLQSSSFRWSLIHDLSLSRRVLLVSYIRSLSPPKLKKFSPKRFYFFLRFIFWPMDVQVFVEENNRSPLNSFPPFWYGPSKIDCICESVSGPCILVHWSMDLLTCTILSSCLWSHSVSRSVVSESLCPRGL